MPIQHLKLHRRYRFDDFELDEQATELRHRGEPLEATARSLQILLTLVRNAGNLTTKTALLASVWQGRVVEQSNIHVHISALRKLIGADSIRTVSTKGYVFNRSVTMVSETVPHQEGGIPFPINRMVGRDGEVARLMLIMERNRLVCLSGFAGVGKTRLAAHVGGHGVWETGRHSCYLDLTESTTSASLLRELGRLLAAKEALNAPSIDQIALRIAGSRMLVIIDTGDQLGDVSETCVTLLARCPNLHVLLVSRQACTFPGAGSIALKPLQLEAARELLLERSLALTDSARAESAPDGIVDRLIAHLDGIPALIEEAALQLRVISIAQLEKVLAESPSDFLNFQHGEQSINTSFAARLRRSIRSLDEDLRHMLVALAGLDGPFRAEEAASHLAGLSIASGEVVTHLRRLAQKSWLDVDRRDGVESFRLYRMARVAIRSGDDLTAMQRSH